MENKVIDLMHSELKMLKDETKRVLESIKKLYEINEFERKKIEEKSKEKEKLEDLDFGEVINYLKKGHKLSRACWKNSNIYIFLSDSLNKKERYIKVHTIRSLYVPWCPNHDEMLSTDWYVINPNKEMEINNLYLSFM